MEDAIRSEEPDREQVGRHLEAFTSGLQQAGALAEAGTAVVEAVSRIAAWLGPLGHGVLAILGL